MKSRAKHETASEVATAPTKGLSRPKPTGISLFPQAIRAVCLALSLLAVWSAILVFYPSVDHVSVAIGEPSPRDIKAPRQNTYISEVKTEEARVAAVAAVGQVYSGPDMEIATRQVRQLQAVTDYVTAIRSDQFADQPRKLTLLREIPSLQLSDTTLTSIAKFSAEEWDAIANETLRLVDVIMREEIRPGSVEDTRRQLLRLLSRSLSAEQQAVVVGLGQSLIVPNSFYDAKQTLEKREAARDAIRSVSWTIQQGESILREGEIVTDLALEKLRVLGLLNSDHGWQNITGTVLLCATMVVVLSAYIVRSHPRLLAQPRRELLLLLTLAVAALVARMGIPGQTLMPYLFPAAAVTMSLAVLLDVQLAMVVSGILAVLVGYNAGGSIEYLVYALAGGMVGGLAISHMDHLGTFLKATAYVALANVSVILAFALVSKMELQLTPILQATGMGLANAVLSSSLAYVAFSFLGRVFGITTSLQLLELARPTHPLFRQLLIKAPGTYHHSLIVSNMAERAAEEIGADALLARVGCYYHDCGKTIQPFFFAENQVDGQNPHDELEPKTSGALIIAHVTEGIALARRHRLPDRVCDFVTEHHGRSLVTYFHRRAVQKSGNEPVNEEDYRYPGPNPQSRETAIAMLADSTEAVVRASHPANQAELERLVRRVVNDRLVGGHLDQSDLTLRDLDRIRESFVSVLQGVFHSRIRYPERTPHPPGSQADPQPQPTEVEKAR